jgi:hypothetical protein
MDILMLALALGFLALIGGLVALCGRLTEPEVGR